MEVVAALPVDVTASEADAQALSEVAGRPAIAHVLERLATVAKLAGIIVVTTTASANDGIAAYCEAHGARCFRGDPDNSIGRVLAAVKSLEAKGGVLVYPANPLIDPALIDKVANLIEMTDGMLDWVGTNLAPSYPRGMDVEGYTAAALQDADSRCADAVVRQQYTAYLRQNARLYRQLSVAAPPEQQRPDLGLSLADPADRPVIADILQHFTGSPIPGVAEILGYLDGK